MCLALWSLKLEVLSSSHNFFNKCSALCLMRTLVQAIGLQQVYGCEGFLETCCLRLHTVHLIVSDDEGLHYSGKEGKKCCVWDWTLTGEEAYPSCMKVKSWKWVDGWTHSCVNSHYLFWNHSLAITVVATLAFWPVVVGPYLEVSLY